MREAKDLLRRVIGNDREHTGANLCLARVLAEEGGAGCPGFVGVNLSAPLAWRSFGICSV